MKALRRGVYAASAVGIVAATALLVLQPATAATTPATTVSVTAAGMSRGGFDPAVAEAHGFKIVTLADGTQESVPVTAAAKALAKTFKVPKAPVSVLGVHATPDATDKVDGDCGYSTISLSRSGTTLTVKTSYYVYTDSYEQYWHTPEKSSGSGSGVILDDFSGLNDSVFWTAVPHTHGVRVGGGAGAVLPGSYAELDDGTICYSGDPATTWG